MYVEPRLVGGNALPVPPGVPLFANRCGRRGSFKATPG